MSTQLWMIGILILGSLTASASQAQAMTTTCQGTYFADQGEKPGDEFEGGTVQVNLSIQPNDDGRNTFIGTATYSGQSDRKITVNYQLKTSKDQGNVASGVGLGNAGQKLKSEIKLGNLGDDGKSLYALLTDRAEDGMRLRSTLKCELNQNLR